MAPKDEQMPPEDVIIISGQLPSWPLNTPTPLTYAASWDQIKMLLADRITRYPGGRSTTPTVAGGYQPSSFTAYHADVDPAATARVPSTRSLLDFAQSTRRKLQGSAAPTSLKFPHRLRGSASTNEAALRGIGSPTPHRLRGVEATPLRGIAALSATPL